MFLLLAGCTMDELRAENAELQAELVRLETEKAELQAQVDGCSSIRELEASAARSFDPPKERCVDGVFTGDPELLSASGMTRAIRLLPNEKGVRVLGLRRGELADSCGFANGDVITAVNGVPLGSAQDWTAPEGSEVRFDALRKGDPVTWTLQLD